MGSVESSIADNIDSLGAALERIEQKMAYIEDSTLHHEASIAHGDCIIIAKKKITCREHVHLLVGPIVGLVTDTSVRLLVEVDADVDVSFFVFVTDPLLTDGKYQFTETLRMTANTPAAIDLYHLEPDTTYLVYIGGVTSKDTLYNYARVSTLSADASLSFSVSHAARLDLPQQHFSLSPYLHITTGNSIPIQAALSTSAVMQLVSFVVDLDKPNQLWEKAVMSLEMNLRKHYRTLLTQDEIRRTLGSRGTLFVAGEMEVGGYLVELLRPYCEYGSKQQTVKEPTQSVAMDHRHDNEGIAPDDLVQSETVEASMDDGDEEEDLPRLDTGLIVEDIHRDLCVGVLGLLLRINRRVYYAYLRQVYDADERFYTIDARSELLHRQILSLRRTLHSKKTSLCEMEATRVKFEERFGRNLPSLKQLYADAQALHETLLPLEDTLRSYYEQGAEIAETFPSPATMLPVGPKRAVVIVDALWSHYLGADGMPILEQRDVEFDKKFWDDWNVNLGLKPAEMAPTSVTPTSTGIDFTPSPISNILVFSPMVLLPVVVDRRDRGRGRVGARVVVEDLHLLLKSLNTWQQTSDRLAAIVCGSDSYYTTAIATSHSGTTAAAATSRCFAVGVLSPIVTQCDAEDEVITEGRVNVVLVPPQHPHLSHVYSSIPLTSTTSPTTEMVSAIGYYGKITARTLPQLSGYYDVSVLQRFVDPLRYLDYEFKPIAESTATPDIVAGPMIGYVTTVAHILLVFYTPPQSIVLQLMDSVTGIVHSNRQPVRNGGPVLFAFSELVSDRLYHVVYNEKILGSFIATSATPMSLLPEPDITIPSSWRCVSPEHRLATSIVEQTLFDSSQALAMKQFESIAMKSDSPAPAPTKKPDLQHERSAVKKFSKAISNANVTPVASSNQPVEPTLYIVGDVTASATLASALALNAKNTSNLFLHLGSPVNLTPSLPLLMKHISDKKLEAAKLQLEIYYTALYSSCSSELMAHGSHIYCSNSEFEVMRACGYTNVLNMMNDLGQDIVSTLFSLVREVSQQYTLPTPTSIPLSSTLTLLHLKLSFEDGYLFLQRTQLQQLLHDVTIRTLILVSPVPLPFYQRASLVNMLELLADASFDSTIITPGYCSSTGTITSHYNDDEGCHTHRTIRLVTVATTMKPFDYDCMVLSAATRCYTVTTSATTKDPIATISLASDDVNLPDTIEPVTSPPVNFDILKVWNLTIEIVFGGNQPETEATLLDAAVVKVSSDMADLFAKAFKLLGENAFGATQGSNGVDVLISMLLHVLQETSEKYRDLLPLVPSRCITQLYWQHILDSTDLPTSAGSAATRANIALSRITVHEDECKRILIELLRLHVVFMHLAFEYGLSYKW